MFLKSSLLGILLSGNKLSLSLLFLVLQRKAAAVSFIPHNSLLRAVQSIPAGFAAGRLHLTTHIFHHKVKGPVFLNPNYSDMKEHKLAAKVSIFIISRRP